MPIFNLLNQSAPSKSIDENSASLINMYLVQDGDQGKYQISAFPTPGCTLFSAGTTSMRADWTQHGLTYGVDGNTFFSVNSSGIRTTLGTLNTTSGWCKIRGISNELFIADSSNGYYYIISTNTFGVIVNSDTTLEYISITSSGSNYINPVVVFTGGGGTGAAATATTTAGEITGITITNNGSGYTSTPTVSFTDSTGTGATAIAVMQQTSFPALIQDIECQDEFGLVLLQTSQEWQASAISDLTTWPVLSFASTTGNQNYNVALVSCHREIYILGTQTSEVWDNLGTANFTFGRNTSVFIEWGCAATASIAKGNNTFFHLARSPTGGNVVVTMNGYTPEVVSTSEVNYQISTYSITSDAIGFIYQQEGHEFYVITFPTAGVTWTYDLTNNLWHQRQSTVNGVQTRWLANCYTFNYNSCLVGDVNTGNIYKLDMTSNTENGISILRDITTHPFYQAGMWIYLYKLQIDFDNTPAAALDSWTLYVSRDGGRTFGTGKPAFPVQDANGMWRVYWNRLGSAHSFVFKLTTTANILPILLGAWANFNTGVSA